MSHPKRCNRIPKIYLFQALKSISNSAPLLLEISFDDIKFSEMTISFSDKLMTELPWSHIYLFFANMKGNGTQPILRISESKYLT